MVGGLELADLLVGRPGEGALLVAEQLAFQQRLGDGGAVQADERAFLARAGVVDGAGDQLLAGAAFAADQHGGVGGGDAADLVVDLAMAWLSPTSSLSTLSWSRSDWFSLASDSCFWSWLAGHAELLGDGDGELQVLAGEGLVRVGAVQVDQPQHLVR